jgi:omega-amidase
VNDLRITLIQPDVFWEDSVRNLALYRKTIREMNEDTDLILIPEMFNTGFSMHPDRCAETMSGPAVQFLSETASGRNCLVIGSILIHDEEAYYNRLLAMYPDGSFQVYDKRHLFILSDEDKVMKAGTDRIIVPWKGWKIMPLICYDLRFPVWSRNTWSNGEYAYDLLLCPSNWPASRTHIFRSLLVARALENISYVAGVNRIGEDGEGTSYDGGSMIIDPKGRILGDGGRGSNILSVVLSANELAEFRKSFNIGPGWDHFTIEK